MKIRILIEKSSGEYDSVMAKGLFIGDYLIVIRLLTGEEVQYEREEIKGLTVLYPDHIEMIPGGVEKINV